ncbi:MAG: nucleoside triphosphate pyrophosphohydrolase, partial [Marinilabiliales bacterium]
MDKRLKEFERLLNIMDELREKCPWDKKQTFESLRKLTIEETFELADAIVKDSPDDIKKEIGDILLHIVFYAKIGEEKKAFDITDVIQSLNEKLIYRHPHIYGQTEAPDEEAVKKNWEALKLKEGEKKTVLGGISEGVPAMVKANRIQEKVKGVGFDWEEKEQVWDKVKEELAE